MAPGTDPGSAPAYLAGLLLAGRRVVAVGGGRVHARRVPALLEAGALVTVVSPTLAPGLAELAGGGRITWVPRGFEASDLDGAWYVLTATDDHEVNAAVAAAAEERHTFCVRADSRSGGSARTPASARSGDVQVGVLAAGDHRRSRELRDRLAALLPAAARPLPDAAGPAVAAGEVVLVGGGPGDPDLLTVGGLRALREADVVLYDHLAPLACLAETRPGTTLLDVGKLPRGPQTPQEEINALLVAHAHAGARVVRLKGGDPFVLGRGGEEWLACVEAGVPVRVVPGVSAAVAGPALAGIPLTHRGLSQDFTVVSGHVGPDHPATRVNWDALAHTAGTIVVLMGVARLGEICTGLVARGLASDTPAAIVARAGLPDQQVVRGTVATLPGLAADAGVEPPALTVVGAVVGLDLAGP